MTAKTAIALLATLSCLNGAAAQSLKPQLPGTDAASTAERRAQTQLSSREPTFDAGTGRRIGEAIKVYNEIAARGGWPAIPFDAKFSAGAAGPSIDLLRRRLIASGDLPPVAISGPYDTQLAAGVKRFQARHGIPATGQVAARTLAALNVPVEKRIDQLEASLQRTSSLGFAFGERYIVVNIPNATAEAVENGVVAQRHRVVVGKTDKPSPTVTSEISNVNLNPTWTVPASITRNEIAAHMRKDPSYLTRMHMRVFDAKDAAIDPASIDWSAEKAPAVTVRQDAGPWNALGQVRIDMPNAYAVYMHDTNQKKLFSADYRFESHGCARVDDIRGLATWLLRDTPEWQRQAIDSTIATGERRDIKLVKKVPVAWIYLTAWASRDGTIQFRDDVYRQDEQLAELTSNEKAFFNQARMN